MPDLGREPTHSKLYWVTIFGQQQTLTIFINITFECPHPIASGLESDLFADSGCQSRL
jgi:hypothetical protein